MTMTTLTRLLITLIVMEMGVEILCNLSLVAPQRHLHIDFNIREHLRVIP